MTGGQAVQCAKAGLESIYLSGWQVAGDANNSGEVYPDQSLYPVSSGPDLARRINKALARADQIQTLEGINPNDENGIDYYLPILADAEAGFGGTLNVFELVKNYIDAGVAGIHLEDQLSSAKKCGHMGGKVLLSTSQGIDNLVAARLAADVMGVDTIIVARTDALSAKLLVSDIDSGDKSFCTGERTNEGFYRTTGGMEQAVHRGLAYAPYSDLIWMETGNPSLEEAKTFADAIHEKFPGKMLAYNCSPSFNWKAALSDVEIAEFQTDLAEMGYAYQFITLAGFHSLNYNMFDLATKYRATGMKGYVELQEKEFAAEGRGYTATKHQREVGATYFDAVSQIVTGGKSSVGAMEGSTEEEQF
jgi:isocitrate lyase